MRVAKLAPITGKVGEEVERFCDRFLAPGFLAEPFIPPFPYETAGAEWYPTLDVTRLRMSSSCGSRWRESTRRTWTSISLARC
jgi:hypothetical protein